MTTITRERLTKILIETMALIKQHSSCIGDSSGISTEVNAELFAEITRIALASLDAKPVYQYRERTYSEWQECSERYYRVAKEMNAGLTRILYTAQLTPKCEQVRRDYAEDVNSEQAVIIGIYERIYGLLRECPGAGSIYSVAPIEGECIPHGVLAHTGCIREGANKFLI
jgi:hypothetical protein